MGAGETKRVMVTAHAQPDPDLASVVLRERLVRAASRHGGIERHAAAEDLAQDALVEALKEELRSGAPAAEVRARRHLKHKVIDWERRRATRRRNELFYEAADAEEDVGLELRAPIDSEARIHQIFAHLQSVLEPEEVTFVLLKHIGCTDEEIATTVPDWDSQRVARVRRRLSRSKRRLVDEINTSIDDHR